MDEFDQVAKDVSIDEETFRRNAILKERDDHSDYPKKTYKHLFGFKTWTVAHCIGITEHNGPGDFDTVRELFHRLEDVIEDANKQYSTGGLGFVCNIERFGIPYGTDPLEVLEFFATVSRATEPFVLWHSNKEHDFTDLHDMDLNEIDSEVVYRIECRNGEAELYEVTYEKVEEEKTAEYAPDFGEDSQ